MKYSHGIIIGLLLLILLLVLFRRGELLVSIPPGSRSIFNRIHRVPLGIIAPKYEQPFCTTGSLTGNTGYLGDTVVPCPVYCGAMSSVAPVPRLGAFAGANMPTPWCPGPPMC